MAAPRFHPSSSWTFERIGPGAEMPTGTLLAPRLGVEVEVEGSSVYFARLNVISRDPDTGEWIGVADPRWRWGTASGPRRLGDGR